MIKVLASNGHETDITVQVLTINGGAMRTLLITDQLDKELVMIYDDEVDSLIEALIKLKGELL